MSQSTSTVTGEVTANNGTQLPGVIIELESSSLPTSRTTITNALGKFQEKLLPSGQYKITATLNGFNPAHNTFFLEENETFPVRITLLPL